MTDPALAAEAARLERLLYSRLDDAERQRIEADYAAVRHRLAADDADPADPAEEAAPAPAVSTNSTTARTVVEPGETQPRWRLAVIATVVALAIGVTAGWFLAPRSAQTAGRAAVSPSSVPLLLIPTASPTPTDMLAVFSRKQVIAADDSSDIPPVNVGSMYSSETFRHLTQLEALDNKSTVVGNVYVALRRSDFAVCLVIVSRTEFVADTCTAAAEVPALGMGLSARIRSVLYDIQWQQDGTAQVLATAL